MIGLYTGENSSKCACVTQLKKGMLKEETIYGKKHTTIYQL